MGSVELLFLGTGTSAGIPMIGCQCPVCTSTDPRDKRTRPCVVISYDGFHVLVDASPELRLQCVAHGVDRIDAIVVTHAHADHIMGLDDVRRFNTIRNGPLDVWADGPTHSILDSCFGYAFRPPDPTAGVYRPHLLRRFIRGPFELHGRKWIPIPLFHGQMPIFGFRVGDLAYCTDCSHVPEEAMKLLTGLKILVIDGLQFRPHPTHLSIDQAVQVAQRLRPGRTYLTHIAHAVGHAATSTQLPAGVELAHDGLRVATGH